MRATQAIGGLDPAVDVEEIERPAGRAGVRRQLGGAPAEIVARGHSTPPLISTVPRVGPCARAGGDARQHERTGGNQPTAGHFGDHLDLDIARAAAARHGDDPVVKRHPEVGVDVEVGVEEAVDVAVVERLGAQDMRCPARGRR